MGNSPVSTTAGDFEGDGRLDLAVVNQGSDTVSLLDGAGKGFFKDSGTFATGLGPIRAFVGHFENGPGQDLVVVNSVSSTLTIYSNFLGPDPQPVTIPTGGLNPIAAIAGDFNGDGYEDLVVANSGDSRITLLDGGPAGLILAGSVALGSSGRPTSLAVSGQSSGDFHFYVSTEGSNAILSVSFSLCRTSRRIPEAKRSSISESHSLPRYTVASPHSACSRAR